MAETFRGGLRGLIDRAVIGFYERLDEFNRRRDIRSTVREIRQIPASDREKKRELARFFQSDGGGRFSTEEKREAYDSLLGERNKRQIG